MTESRPPKPLRLLRRRVPGGCTTGMRPGRPHCRERICGSRCPVSRRRVTADPASSVTSGSRRWPQSKRSHAASGTGRRLRDRSETWIKTSDSEAQAQVEESVTCQRRPQRAQGTLLARGEIPKTGRWRGREPSAAGAASSEIHAGGGNRRPAGAGLLPNPCQTPLMQKVSGACTGDLLH